MLSPDPGKMAPDQRLSQLIIVVLNASRNKGKKQANNTKKQQLTD